MEIILAKPEGLDLAITQEAPTFAILFYFSSQRTMIANGISKFLLRNQPDVLQKTSFDTQIIDTLNFGNLY